MARKKKKDWEGTAGKHRDVYDGEYFDDWFDRVWRQKGEYFPHYAEALDWHLVNQMRRGVVHTGSLVAGGRVGQQMTHRWAADMDKRVILWSPVWPNGDHLNHDSFTFVVGHEASHLAHSGGIEWNDALTTDQEKMRFFRLYNAIEDIRINRLCGERLPGFRYYCVKFYKKIWAGWHTDDVMIGVGPTDAGGLWFIFREYDLKLPTIQPETRKICRRWAKRIDEIVSTARSSDEVAKRIWPLYLELIENEPPEPQEGGGEGEEGQGQSGGQNGSQGGVKDGVGGVDLEDGLGGEGDKEGKGKKGKGDKIGKDAGAAFPSFGEMSEDDDQDRDLRDGGSGIGMGSGYHAPDEPFRSKHDPNDDTRSSSPGNRYENSRNIWDQIADDAVLREVAEALRERAIKEGHREADIKKVIERMSGRVDVLDPAWKDGEREWDNALAKSRSVANSLGQRLRSILRHNAQESFEHGKKRGRLHAPDAWRSFTGNRYIFRQRTGIGTYDYTVGLIVDCSGSMARYDDPTPLEVVAPLAKALEIAGVRNFIIPWSDNPHGIKRIDHSLENARGFLGRQIQPRGGTYEAPTLTLVSEAMDHTSSPGKILICVTDGGTEWVQESTALLADMESKGVICIGIGIGGANPSHYTNHFAVNDTRELAVLVPKILQRLIRRGR